MASGRERTELQRSQEVVTLEVPNPHEVAESQVMVGGTVRELPIPQRHLNAPERANGEIRPAPQALSRRSRAARSSSSARIARSSSWPPARSRSSVHSRISWVVPMPLARGHVVQPVHGLPREAHRA